MQCILVETYFERNYAYENIHYIKISTVGRSNKMHYIYQNLNNIYCCVIYYLSLSVLVYLFILQGCCR